MLKRGKKVEFKGIKKHLTVKNILVALIGFFIYLMFSDLAKAIVFTALLFPVGTISIKVSRLMPNTSLDIIGPCTFFLGYLYGWPVGAFYGVVLGAFMWSRFYSISQFVLFNLLLNGLVAALGGFFRGLPWTFQLAYFVALIIRNILYFGIGGMIGNQMENTTHTIGNAISNLILFPQIIFILYNFAKVI